MAWKRGGCSGTWMVWQMCHKTTRARIRGAGRPLRPARRLLSYRTLIGSEGGRADANRETTRTDGPAHGDPRRGRGVTDTQRDGRLGCDLRRHEDDRHRGWFLRSGLLASRSRDRRERDDGGGRDPASCGFLCAHDRRHARRGRRGRQRRRPRSRHPGGRSHLDRRRRLRRHDDRLRRRSPTASST